MFNARLKADLQAQALELSAHRALIEALRGQVPIVEFTPDGIIVDANPLFLGVVGYPLDQVRGHHHRLFCSPELGASSAYRQFWQELRNGRAQRGTFPRIAADGKPLWLEATYLPVSKPDGHVTRILKIAADVSAQRAHQEAQQAVLDALDRSLAVIESSPPVRSSAPTPTSWPPSATPPPR